jgi:hypothetical protein|tara:strand:+ start:120 stop:260 length:141 start_codon:yes stop_codon:yes gene_type:complete
MSQALRANASTVLFQPAVEQARNDQYRLTRLRVNLPRDRLPGVVYA